MESYPCEEVCGDRLRPQERERQNCSRVDLPIVQWQASEEAYTCWMGLPPDRVGEKEGRPFWNTPHEPLDEGCPAGWYRSEFARSLAIYLPTQTESGFMESPLIDRTAPRLLIEAVQLYKREKAKANANFLREAYDG